HAALSACPTRRSSDLNLVRPEAVCLVDEGRIKELCAALDYEPVVLTGEAGLLEIARLTNADMVLVAVVGTGGLRPALAAIEAGKDRKSTRLNSSHEWT